MPPPQQGAPIMELAPGTERAISGHMQANRKEAFLDPAICLICYDHTFGPAVVVTASCGHHFHPKCIEDAMRRNPEAGTKCPCGAAFPPGREPVVDAARMHKQMMNGIEVQCPQGCGEVMPFEHIHAHVHNADGCPNTPYRCGNEGCGVLCLRKDKDEHLRVCLHRLTPCELCQQPVKHGELQQHKADLCPRRKVRCPHCEGEHDFIEGEQHMRRCTGVVTMMNLAELREMMNQQQEATAQLREQVTQLQRTNAEQQRTIAEQQQTNERQQREIAKLRNDMGPLLEQRRREEQERRQRAALPQRLTVNMPNDTQNLWKGEYSLRPERVNGAAVWGKGDCRIYKSREGHWVVVNLTNGPQDNLGVFRLTSQPGSSVPLGDGGWEYCTAKHWNVSRADGWTKGQYHAQVTVA